MLFLTWRDALSNLLASHFLDLCITSDFHHWSFDYSPGHILGISFEFLKLDIHPLTKTTYSSSFLTQELHYTYNVEDAIVK